MSVVLERVLPRSPRGRVYNGTIAELAESGIDVGGQHLTTGKFGGLLSFDGVHFTDIGYAMLANLFVDTLNDVLATAVPPLDLGRVIESDAGSPASIAAAGLDVSLCQ